MESRRTIQMSDFHEPPQRRAPRAPLPDLDLLEVEDVALYYGLKPAAIRKRIRLHRLGPWSLQGRRWTIRKATFERWLDEQEHMQDH